MTPLDLILRSPATIMALALAAAAGLALGAALFDYLSGTTGATPPFLFARERRLLFLLVGVPALLVLFASGSLLAGIGAGSVAPGATAEALLLVVDVSFGVAVSFAGVCSPLARNWVLSSAALFFAVVLFVALLAAVAAQPTGGETGLLSGFGPRLAFGVTVGAIWLALAVGCGALFALLVYAAERVALLLHARRGPLSGERRRA